MRLDTSTKSIFWTFGLTRILLIFITYVAFSIFTAPGNYANDPVDIAALLSSWMRWDAINYLDIAQHGYRLPEDFAFFPLFPLLTAIISYPFGPGSQLLIATLISNAALLGALLIIHRLALQFVTEDVAQRAILYLCLFPTAFFFFAAYNESLYVLCTAATFWALSRQKWWLAGLVGFCAALTRSIGLLLIVPYLYELWIQRATIRHSAKTLLLACGPLLLIPLGMALYAAYNWWLTGNPLAFIDAQVFWSRHRAWPWQGIWQSLAVLFWYNPFPFGSSNQAHTLIDLTATLAFIALIVIGWRKLPRSYSLWMSCCLLFILISPATKPDVLLSNQRFVLELFPAFITLALIGQKYIRFHYVQLLLFPTLQAVLAIAFMLNRWIV